MTEQEQSGKPERCIRIGPDQVTVTGNEVVIEARREMPDWEVRSSKAPAIYFEDKKYLLTEKRPAQPPYAMRYVLKPWPEGKIANDRVFHTYDAEAVANRDSSRRGETIDELVWACLLPLYPFLGFLWSGTQHRLVRFGFMPRTITGISIFAAFCLFFLQAVMCCIMINGSARSGTMMIGGIITALSGHNFVSLGFMNFPLGIADGVLLLALITDVAMRYTHYLREDQWTGGFFEWLAPQSLRRK